MRIESILTSSNDRSQRFRPLRSLAIAVMVGVLVLPMAGGGSSVQADDASSATVAGEATFARELPTIRMPGSQGAFTQPIGPATASEIFANSKYLDGLGDSEATEAIRAVVANTAWVHPLPDAKVTSTFGYRRHPMTGKTVHHDGLDLAAPLGTAIRAAASGRVVRATATDTAEGTVIVIDHGDGLSSKYTHLGPIRVEPGQEVEAGAVIAEVGLTGETTGPHLHVEIQLGGHPIDPNFLVGC